MFGPSVSPPTVDSEFQGAGTGPLPPRLRRVYQFPPLAKGQVVEFRKTNTWPSPLAGANLGEKAAVHSRKQGIRSLRLDCRSHSARRQFQSQGQDRTCSTGVITAVGMSDWAGRNKGNVPNFMECT